MNERLSFDKFEPLTETERAAIPTLEDVAIESGECVMPVPADAPPMLDAHPKLGKPSARWHYRDAAGALLSEVWRFDSAGGKEFRQLSLWRISGRLKWQWAGVPAPRPLYGLERLAANPGASVVICEGEKAADAAARIFQESVCITSPNGSQSAKNADWKPLAGRRVIIWPDSDEPGTKYAAAVAGDLHGLGCEVSIINADALASLTPEGGNREPTKGWDAADAVKEWEDLEALREAAANHTNSIAADEGAADDDEFGREIARLAALSIVYYERERTVAARKLHVRAAILDKLVEAARLHDEPAPGQGRKLELNEPEPWPVPVSGPELIGELEAGISRYVALPKDGAFSIALWVLHTYCFDSFTCTPRLAITAPEKRCGKSTLIDVLYPLVPRALLTVNTSPAAVFRTGGTGKANIAD